MHGRAKHHQYCIVLTLQTEYARKSNFYKPFSSRTLRNAVLELVLLLTAISANVQYLTELSLRQCIASIPDLIIEALRTIHDECAITKPV